MNELHGEVLYEYDLDKKEILLNDTAIDKYKKNLFKKDYDKYNDLVSLYKYFSTNLLNYWLGINNGVDKENLIRLLIRTSELYSDIMFLQLRAKAKFYVIYSGLDQALSYYITDDEDNVNDYANSIAFKGIEGLYYDELKHNMGYKKWTINDVVGGRDGSNDLNAGTDDNLHVLWGEINGDYCRLN